MPNQQVINNAAAALALLSQAGFEGRTFTPGNRWETQVIATVAVSDDIFTNAYEQEDGNVLRSLVLMNDDGTAQAVTIGNDRNGNPHSMNAAAYKIVKLTLKEGAEHDWMQPGEFTFRAEPA